MLQCKTLRMNWLSALWQWISGTRLSSRQELRRFLESRSAYLTQKSISEYTQARANMMFSTLMAEKTFQRAYEKARWLSFPAALAMVAEAIAARLRQVDSAPSASINTLLVAMAGEIVAAYPVPAGGDADFWHKALADLERDLDRASLAAPHAVHLIPKPRAREIFENLPVHASVRKHDFEMFRNTLRFHLTEIAAEIEKGLGAEAARHILRDAS